MAVAVVVVVMKMALVVVVRIFEVQGAGVTNVNVKFCLNKQPRQLSS
jgi:hypothetical protein